MMTHDLAPLSRTIEADLRASIHDARAAGENLSAITPGFVDDLTAALTP